MQLFLDKENYSRLFKTLPALGTLLLSIIVSPATPAQSEPLKICVATPDVQSLVESIGADLVEVFCFTKAAQDPHVVDIRPSFVEKLDQADLLIQVGLGIENAWLGQMMERVQQEKFLPGKAGNLNLGVHALPLEGETGKPIPDSFHEEGNPHYLLDPVEGLRCARDICDKLVEMRPESKVMFEANHQLFARSWMKMFFGESLAGRLDVKKFADFENREALEKNVVSALQQHENQLEGVSGLMKPLRKMWVVGDHDLWPWFARRFELQVLDYLEPAPGIPPTTQHLTRLIARMKENKVPVILTAPYFPIRHAKLVERSTQAVIIPMSHQTQARIGSEDYLKMIENNCKSITSAAFVGR